MFSTLREVQQKNQAGFIQWLDSTVKARFNECDKSALICSLNQDCPFNRDFFTATLDVTV